MNSYETLKVEHSDDFVVHVKLNRPEKRNALNLKMWHEIGDVFTKLEEDPTCRVVILSGEGKVFNSAGFFDQLQSEGDPARQARHVRRIIFKLQEPFNRIEKCTKPVIAALHGMCIGAAMDIISACDIRHCTKDTIFSIKEVDMGLAADVGSLNRLPKILGNDSWLKEKTYSAPFFNADEALRFGLVSKVYENKEELMSEVMKMAKAIASKSPVAVQGSKVVLNYSRDHTVDESLNFVATWNQSQLFTEDIPASGMTVMTKSPMPPFSKL